MTRLVVHAGTHGTDWTVTQRQLVSWRTSLESAGVWLHPADEAAAWAADAVELAESAAPESIESAAKEAVKSGATILLLSAEKLEDALRDPTQVSNISRFARDHGMRLTVLVAVRDQIGYLNELYCDRVTHLQMARDFASFVSDPQPAERFDYETAFDAVLDVPDIDFVAVPYRSLPDGLQARTLLTAIGIPARDLGDLPHGPLKPTLPGPVTIAATRLLFKRMWRMGMFKSLSRPLLLDAAAELRRHADSEGWDEAPYWGWTEQARKQAIRQYRPSNDVFANSAWGHAWGDQWESGSHVEVDIAASAPELVADLLRHVDRIVKELQQAKLALASDTTAQE